MYAKYKLMKGKKVVKINLATFLTCFNYSIQKKPTCSNWLLTLFLVSVTKATETET